MVHPPATAHRQPRERRKHNDNAAGTPTPHALAWTAAQPLRTIEPRHIPTQPGVYTLWAPDQRLLYAGLAGVRWTAERPGKSTLRQRISDHIGARRADVLTSYLFEREIAPHLTPEQLQHMGEGTLTLRSLVRDLLNDCRISWTTTTTYPEAKTLEDAVRNGLLGSTPVINPLSHTDKARRGNAKDSPQRPRPRKTTKRH